MNRGDKVHGNYEYVFVQPGSNLLYIHIQRTRLSTPDLAGFQAWLKANPVTIVYELAEPNIVSLPNINPRTFEDKTIAIINSGVIQADATFDATNSLRSEIEVLKDKANGDSFAKALIKKDYFGMAHNDGTDQDYMRTTEKGIIPYKEGGSSNCGTDRWAFTQVVGKTVVGQNKVTMGDGINTIVSLNYHSPTGSRAVVECYEANENGSAVALGAGALTVVGGGEAGGAYIRDLPDGGDLTTERTVLCSDNQVIIRTNVQGGFKDVNKITFDNGGMSIGASTGNVKKTTISAYDPSGGSGGDIWLQYI